MIFDGPQDATAMPLVDDQRKHRRLVPLSLGIMSNEVAIADPVLVDWSKINNVHEWAEERAENSPDSGS